MSTNNYNTNTNRHAHETHGHMAPGHMGSGNASRGRSAYGHMPSERTAPESYARGNAENPMYCESYEYDAYEGYDPYARMNNDRMSGSYDRAPRQPYGNAYGSPRASMHRTPERRPRRGAAVAVAVALVLALGGVGGAVLLTSKGKVAQPVTTVQTQTETKKSAPTTPTQTKTAKTADQGTSNTGSSSNAGKSNTSNTGNAGNSGNTGTSNAGTAGNETANVAAQEPQKIGDDAALKSALSNLGLSSCDTSAIDLVEGGDAPHYKVTLTSGDQTYSVEVDAYTGSIMQ